MTSPTEWLEEALTAAEWARHQVRIADRTDGTHEVVRAQMWIDYARMCFDMSERDEGGRYR